MNVNIGHLCKFFLPDYRSKLQLEIPIVGQVLSIACTILLKNNDNLASVWVNCDQYDDPRRCYSYMLVSQFLFFFLDEVMHDYVHCGYSPPDSMEIFTVIPEYFLHIVLGLISDSQL